MNEIHLTMLASPEWAETLRRELLPWALDGVDLGDEVLELGPGPGLTTDLLWPRVAALTALELDGELAAALAERMRGTDVRVAEGDATRTGFEDNRFSSVVCFSMLHHVPTAADQDLVFVETCRVLAPGGRFLGVDAVDSPRTRGLHVDDVFVPMAPETLTGRLGAAGFVDVTVEHTDQRLRFRAAKPKSPGG